MYTSELYINVPGLIIVGIVTFIIVIALAKMVRKNQAMLNTFAAKHGYTLTERLVKLPGTEDSYYLAPLRDNSTAPQKFTNIIQGSRNGKAFRIFSYFTYIAVDGMFMKNRAARGREKSTMVVEMEHKGSWPNIYFQRNIFNMGKTQGMIYAFQPFNLGTEFDTYFGTFCLPQEQANVQQWFDINKQNAVLNATGRTAGFLVKGRSNILSLEFTPSKLYLYIHYLGSEAIIDDMLSAAEEIISGIK
jgi:hypothetical protein